eukprot:51397-Pelagomonas_calceolata.AAC.2
MSVQGEFIKPASENWEASLQQAMELHGNCIPGGMYIQENKCSNICAQDDSSWQERACKAYVVPRQLMTLEYRQEMVGACAEERDKAHKPCPWLPNDAVSENHTLKHVQAMDLCTDKQLQGQALYVSRPMLPSCKQAWDSRLFLMRRNIQHSVKPTQGIPFIKLVTCSTSAADPARTRPNAPTAPPRRCELVTS